MNLGEVVKLGPISHIKAKMLEVFWISFALGLVEYTILLHMI